MAKVTVTGAVAVGIPFLNVMVVDENVALLSVLVRVAVPE